MGPFAASKLDQTLVSFWLPSNPELTLDDKFASKKDIAIRRETSLSSRTMRALIALALGLFRAQADTDSTAEARRGATILVES